MFSIAIVGMPGAQFTKALLTRKEVGLALDRSIMLLDLRDLDRLRTECVTVAVGLTIGKHW